MRGFCVPAIAQRPHTTHTSVRFQNRANTTTTIKEHHDTIFDPPRYRYPEVRRESRATRSPEQAHSCQGCELSETCRLPGHRDNPIDRTHRHRNVQRRCCRHTHEIKRDPPHRGTVGRGKKSPEPVPFTAQRRHAFRYDDSSC